MEELFQNFFDPKMIESLQSDYIVPWAINIVTALAIFLIGRLVVSGILALANKLLGRTKMDSMLVNFIMSILYALLLLFVIVASLDQLGVNTSSLIALVGAAGLAIGLSLQDSLKNFAAGVMLVIFRPFREGEFVEVNGISGIAEKITIFNTIMRTGDGREVTVPNGPIYSDTITNYSRRATRRVDMVFGIGYDADLLKAKNILKELVEADERVLKDPAPVIAVSELADSSVNFIVRPWVNTPDYWGFYWDMMERVKLRFDEEGISIPFPQMDVHLYKEQEQVPSDTK